MMRAVVVLLGIVLGSGALADARAQVTIQTDLEPIFLLCNDDGALEAELQVDLEGATWLTSYRDEFGHTHSIAAIRNPDRIEHYQSLLDGQSSLIADGHHRYEVSRRYAEEVDATTGTGPACKLVILVSLGSPHLTIDPIHRAVRVPVDLEPLHDYIGTALEWNGETGSGLALATASAGQPAITLWKKGSQPLICTLDAERIIERHGGPLPDLPVSLFHSLFDLIGWDEGAASDGTIIYRSDPDRLLQEMVAGEFEASFWLPPMSAGGFSNALEICPLLPPKSTRFLPKLASGLVWARHDTELS